MPYPREVGGVLRVATCRCAQKSYCSAGTVSGNNCGKRGILNARRCSYIRNVAPGSAMIVRDRCHGMAIGAVPSYIHGVIRSHADGRVTITRGTAGNGVYRPGSAIIPGNDHAYVAIAVFVWDISSAVRPNLDVTMQAAAVHQRVDRNSRAIRQ